MGVWVEEAEHRFPSSLNFPVMGAEPRELFYLPCGESSETWSLSRGVHGRAQRGRGFCWVRRQSFPSPPPFQRLPVLCSASQSLAQPVFPSITSASSHFKPSLWRHHLSQHSFKILLKLLLSTKRRAVLTQKNVSHWLRGSEPSGLQPLVTPWLWTAGLCFCRICRTFRSVFYLLYTPQVDVPLTYLLGALLVPSNNFYQVAVNTEHTWIYITSMARMCVHHREGGTPSACAEPRSPSTWAQLPGELLLSSMATDAGADQMLAIAAAPMTKSILICQCLSKASLS